MKESDNFSDLSSAIITSRKGKFLTDLWNFVAQTGMGSGCGSSFTSAQWWMLMHWFLFSGKQQQLRCTTRLIYFIITLHSFQLWLLLVLMLGWICNKRCVLQCLLLFKQTHPHQSVNKGFGSKQNKKHLSRWGNQVYTGAKWLCENTELSRSPESPLSHRTTDIWKLRKWFTSCVFEKKKKFLSSGQTYKLLVP